MIQQYRHIFSLRKGAYTKIFANLVISILLVLATLYEVYFIGYMIDLVAIKDKEQFAYYLPILFAVTITKILLTYLQKWVLSRVKANFSYDLRGVLLKKELNSSIPENQKFTSAHILSIFQNQMESMVEFIDHFTDFIIIPITVIITTVYLSTINLKLLLCAVVLIPLSSFVYGKLSIPVQKKRREIVKMREEHGSLSKDVIHGFVTMKAYQLENFFSKQYEQKANALAKKEKELERINGSLGRVFILLRYIPQLIIPLFGGYLTYKGEISLGELMIVNSMIFYIILPIEGMLGILKKKRLVLADLEGMNDLLLRSEEETTGDIEVLEDVVEGRRMVLRDQKVTGNPQETVQVRQEGAVIEENKEIQADEEPELSVINLSFGYEETKEILHNVNLTLNKGEHVILLGESGSGKSTFIKNICGFFMNYKGSIELKGVPLTNENIRTLRRQISYVPQHPYIFCGTIYENICFDRAATRDEVYEAAVAAKADEFIKELPNGYDTVVGEGGLKLSGGQAQRIAIARGILKNCDLFILDEPTSALDNESEQTIIDNFQTILENKSVIIITHRESVIRDSDTVKRFKEGQLYDC